MKNDKRKHPSILVRDRKVYRSYFVAYIDSFLSDNALVRRRICPKICFTVRKSQRIAKKKVLGENALLQANSENNFVSSCFAGMLAFCVLYFASSLPDCTSLIAGVIGLNRKSRSIIDMLYEYFGLVLGCIDADLCK